ncbi:MAG: LapA family protein [Desulfotignum sp.]|nr:LapA family protein [Desulfotignum sp.]MCF8126369.1 LapA family protein [Desulfotignum sp.]
MKTIKFLFLLIILGLLGLLIYQNIDYFTTVRSLTLDLKFNQWQWTVPALPNWAFWGICFGLGLLITGLKGLVTAFRLGREIKKKDAQIEKMKARNTDLQSRLDVFIHDPYIKKGLSGTPENEETDTKEPEPEKTHAPEPDTTGPGLLEKNESDTRTSEEKNGNK